MVFSEYFIITLIIKIKVTIELLDYKVIIKLKVVKIIKFIISLLKFTSVVARTIILTSSKLIKLN